MFIRVNQRIVNRGEPKEVWFVMEVEAHSMAEVGKALNESRFLCGWRYDTQADGPNRRKVVGCMETCIAVDTISSVQDLLDDVVEDDGTVLWTVPDLDTEADARAVA